MYTAYAVSAQFLQEHNSNEITIFRKHKPRTECSHGPRARKSWRPLPFPLTEVTTGFLFNSSSYCTLMSYLIPGLFFLFFREGPLPPPFPTGHFVRGLRPCARGRGRQQRNCDGASPARPFRNKQTLSAAGHLQDDPLIYISYATETKFQHAQSECGNECLTILPCREGGSLCSLHLSSF